jgi:hypothetical protein
MFGFFPQEASQLDAEITETKRITGTDFRFMKEAIYIKGADRRVGERARSNAPAVKTYFRRG